MNALPSSPCFIPLLRDPRARLGGMYQDSGRLYRLSGADFSNLHLPSAIYVDLLSSAHAHASSRLGVKLKFLSQGDDMDPDHDDRV